ncbi:hypothetical protein SAMN05216207_107811 [Pseudonocardia ammonioxydans]|uniref:Uncharacterized protein n=1 Tax=Pseudonocardia ammonioxydans TaxID=260086 RepID=A0A1I5HXQ8_PSUAM|nr:hypothetical protein [Pseudonocardia ammonioxydans]SFO52706.1 hypothetical protein SAMN05216207_107811 [Pseudonocardia ammonioxydans]
MWDAVLGDFELEEHELALLREAVRCVDTLDQLDAIVRADSGPIDPSGRVHPGVVEARQLRVTLARVLAALRLPSGDEDEARPQRRAGVRGTYATGGGQAPRLRRVR